MRSCQARQADVDGSKRQRIDDPSDERMRESYLTEFPGYYKIAITGCRRRDRARSGAASATWQTDANGR
jgi:hypothetical protein